MPGGDGITDFNLMPWMAWGWLSSVNVFVRFGFGYCLACAVDDFSALEGWIQSTGGWKLESVVSVDGICSS